jgi:formate--tetrahydrofolate ligase
VTGLADQKPAFHTLYPDDMPLAQKIRTVATEIYGAAEVSFEPAAQSQLQAFEAAGFGALPVCMAKTQYSFSADPAWKGAAENFTLKVREVRLSAGAGFVVALCGEILTMPGLPRHAAAEQIFIDAEGHIGGLS